MRTFARLARVAGPALLVLAARGETQGLSVLPDQTSRVRLSNHDINHVICVGGEIADVKFSAEKGVVVERGGSDAWIKFLIVETDDMGARTRSYVTAPAEFFVSCNGAIYPLYAEPADIAAQTVMLIPGTVQRAHANEALLGPLAEEERAVSIILSLLQDHVPASFSDVAPQHRPISLSLRPDLRLTERRRLSIEGADLSVSDYALEANVPTSLDERMFLDTALGQDLFALTLDRLSLADGETARLIVVRRSVLR